MTWLIGVALMAIFLSRIDWICRILVTSLVLSLVLPAPDSWIRDTIPSVAVSSLALYFVYSIVSTLYFGLSNSRNSIGGGSGASNSSFGDMGGDSGGDGGGGVGGGDGGGG
ncbi:MAG: hypothetical protein AB8B84_14235 [Granulosicoccus sp.]